MTNEKDKNQHTLPNRQMARIFNFSAQDLAVNRAGFMSRAQAWGIPLWVRRMVGNLGSGIPFRLSQRARISRICGRARLDYVQRQTHSHFHTDIREYHYLYINDRRFLLTPAQHRIIGEGMPYHVYYEPESLLILSIERAINGCSET